MCLIFPSWLEHDTVRNENLIDKMTREYMPWPIHAPRGRELSLSQWNQVFKTKPS